MLIRVNNSSLLLRRTSSAFCDRKLSRPQRSFHISKPLSQQSVSLTHAQPNHKFLRLFFNNHNASHADYHYFWLRHNCTCKEGCVHPTTSERLIDSSEIPLEVQPDSVKIIDSGTKVEVVWRDHPKLKQHKSIFDVSWLTQHAYAPNRQSTPPPPSDVSQIEIDYPSLLKKYGNSQGILSPEGQRFYLNQCGTSLKEHGAVVVRGKGLDTEQIISEVLPEGCEVISTHFGRIEDLRTDNTTNKNTDQLGYTDAGVHLHTDQPFIENPPGMQLLQCITPADQGGDNFIVDAKKAAVYLREIDPTAFDLISTVPVKFHRKQKNFESIQIRPIIEIQDGNIRQVRYSYFTYAPHMLPFERMEQWYRACNTFAELVRNPEHQYKFRLNSGDFVLYDNWRMFHARNSFKGRRHLRGVYFDGDHVYQKLLGERYQDNKFKV